SNWRRTPQPLPATADRSQTHLEKMPQRPPSSALAMLDSRGPDPDIASAGVKHTLALRPRVVARDVQHQVVMLAALREILFRVVDDPVRADRAHDFDMARAADRGDLSAKRFGDLD